LPESRNVNWNSILEGITTGVVAAVLLAIFALLRHRVRDMFFRWKLWRDLHDFGFGSWPEGLTIGIRNHVGKTFTVRKLAVPTDQARYLANPTTDVISSSKEEIRSAKIGDKAWGVTTLQALNESRMFEGFAAIEPFTQRTFLFSNVLFGAGHDDGTPTALRITIEYEAWPERRKVVQWDIKKRASDIAAKFAEMRKRVRGKGA
jgi:hypothetical protein